MNRSINILASAILIATFFSACSKMPEKGLDEKSLIYLSAGTGAVKSPYTNETPSENSPLNALVCVSTDDFLFPSDGKDGTEDGTIGKHIHAQFQSGTSQLINGAYYNRSYPMDVYFSAFHPQSGWTFTDNNTASLTFNGSHDVMFAPQVSGKYGNNTPPTLDFRHLLTWLKLEISAESDAVATAWGPLKSITIESSNKVSIDLSKTFNPDDVKFSNEKVAMNFYKTGADEVFPVPGNGYTMTTEVEEVGYVLCEPVQAIVNDPYASGIVRVPEYKMTIVSQYRNVTVDIDLKDGVESYFGSNTMGQQFTLNLMFKMGNTIAVSTGITDWQTGGIGIGKIEE